jgi:hypothetical protein
VARPAVRAGQRLLRVTACLSLLGGALGLWPSSSALASCVGPELAVLPAGAPPPPVVSVSAEVTVTGEWFRSGCDDTGQGSGCGAPESEEAPLEDVELHLEQDGRSVPLGTADAADKDRRYAIAWDVELPAGLRPGPAVLHAADAALPVQLTA